MGLVQHGSGVGLAPDNQTIISTTVDIFDEEGNNIGFVNSINRNDTRGVFPIRHLDSADAGRILELQPQVENYTLTVTGFALFNVSDVDRGSLLNRLPADAKAFKVLNDQVVPFVMEQTETHPSTGATNTTVYLGCMLTSFSRPINVGNATVTETAAVTVSWVE